MGVAGEHDTGTISVEYQQTGGFAAGGAKTLGVQPRHSLDWVLNRPGFRGGHLV